MKQQHNSISASNRKPDKWDKAFKNAPFTREELDRAVEHFKKNAYPIFQKLAKE